MIIKTIARISYREVDEDVLFKRRAIVAQRRAERNPQYSAAASAPKAAAPNPRLEDEELAFLKRAYAQTVQKANVISSRPKQAVNSAAQSYAAWAKAAEQGKFDQQAYVKAVNQHNLPNVACTLEAAQKPKSWWDKYGEWVHGGLDAVGLIPVYGEIADGVNALIYLGEGRHIEAGISAAAMIPVVGDLGKGGKWGVKIGKEIIEQTIEGGVARLSKEITEWLTKESAGEFAETLAKRAGVDRAVVSLESGLVYISRSSEQAIEAAGQLAKTAFRSETWEKAIKEFFQETVHSSGNRMIWDRFPITSSGRWTWAARVFGQPAMRLGRF